MNNEELIRKAMITADSIAANGKLNPKQANKFIDYVFDLTGLKDRVRTVRFTNEKMDIDKINIGRRAAVPKAEGRDPGVRRGISTTKITIEPKEIMVPVEIGDNFKRINIEGEDVEDHVIRMFATQLGNDIEEMGLHGDKLGPAVYEADIVDEGSQTLAVKDSYLGLADGWLKRARNAHVVDFGGANIGSPLMSQMLEAVPEKYKRRLDMMRFMLASNSEQRYRQSVSARATAAGDAALNSRAMLTPFGVGMQAFPLFGSTPKVTLHVTLTALLTTSLGGFKSLIEDSELVVPVAIGNAPIAPYVKDTDYLIDYVAGTLARKAGTAIGDGATVKITFQGEAQILLGEYQNLIAAIGLDVTIEKDRDIFKGVNQYAITAKIDFQIEETDALAWGKNLGLG